MKALMPSDLQTIDCMVSHVATTILTDRVSSGFAKTAKLSIRDWQGMGEKLAFNLSAYVLEHEVRKVKRRQCHYIHIPATWWDAFKKAYVPKWAYRWISWKDKTIAIQEHNTVYIRSCPHTGLGGQSDHVRWMAFGPDKKKKS